jgi:hypothetical protein
MPRTASTAFLGGGRRQQVMNLIALTSVSVAMCLRTVRQTAAISSGVKGSRGCAAFDMVARDEEILIRGRLICRS